MTLLPEVREELMATAARRTASTRARRRHRFHRWLSRVPAGGVAVALSTLCTVAVAAVALVALGHRAPRAPLSPAGRAPVSSVRTLEAVLGVLRRPQTAADRSYPVHPSPRGRQGPPEVIPKLTRLAATITTPTAGQMRVFVIVRKLPTGRMLASPEKPGADVVSAVAVAADGELQNGSGALTAATLDSPSAVGSGSYTPGATVNPNRGVTVGIVPDGVTRVKWIFTGAAFGVSHPREVTVYPQVGSNVAVAPIKPGEGPLAHATWYGAAGQVIASASGGAQARQQLQLIRSVNASRSNAVAPSLLAHYALFRSVPTDDPARDPTLPTPGTDGGYIGEMRLNYWQTRYVASVTGLDGRGLWITPGTRGLCMSDPQTSGCGMLSSLRSTGFIGGATLGAHQETISGLVPDGNPTVTIVLASGARKTVPVVDDNVYEATVPGRIVAIIARNTAGQIERKTLQ